MVKLGRMEIPKSEEDVKRINEEIEKNMEMHQHSHSDEDALSDVDSIVHQLGHVQELLIHIIQSIKEVRNSIDNLTSVIRKNSRIIALAYMLNVINNEEDKRKIVEIISKDLNLDINIE
jgi:ferritin